MDQVDDLPLHPGLAASWTKRVGMRHWPSGVHAHREPASTISPPQLSDAAREVWDRLAPDLEDKGCLTAWDADMFGVYCEAVATFYECRRAIGSDYIAKGSVKDTTVKSPLWRIMKDAADTMRTIGAKFGLTPSDRAGLDTSGTTPKYHAERLLG